MLAKSQRLNLTHSFKSVTSGSRSETVSMKLFWKMTDSSTPLIGIAVAKKTLRKATERNKAKRLVSGAVEQIYDQLQPGLNLVIMPKLVVLDKTVDELREELVNEKRLYRTD